MSTSSGSDIASGRTIKLSLRARPPATIIYENSPTSTWIDLLKDEVLPLLKERENNITVYHAPIGFENSSSRLEPRSTQADTAYPGGSPKQATTIGS
jgi:hypothetical protein